MKIMKHKKILSAVMAIAMLGSMQAMAVSAEETENEESIETVEAIENAENNSNPDQEQDQDSSQESEIIPDATDSNLEPDVPATTPPQTDAPATTMTIMTTMTTVATIATPVTSETDAEVISSDLAQPKIGDFKVSPAPSGADGENAVISWDAVDGADGYQVYRTLVEQKDPDTPVSYSFDVKGTSYQTAGSTAYKETIKVRAFRLVDGERVYSAWSENKTVYLNGMEEPGNSSSGESTTTVATAASGNNSSGTTTTKSSTTATKATTKAESTTRTGTEQLTGSPKTGDTSSAGLWICVGVTTAISAFATRRKKQDQ